MATLAAFRFASRRIGSATVARSTGLARGRWMSSYPPHEVVGMPSLSPVSFFVVATRVVCVLFFCQSADRWNCRRWGSGGACSFVHRTTNKGWCVGVWLSFNVVAGCHEIVVFWCSKVRARHAMCFDGRSGPSASCAIFFKMMNA